MDNQSVVMLAAVVINVVAVGWNIRETFVLHRQSKELQKSNANLQNEVHRLSVHLNQEIIRLERINELTRGMYLSWQKIYQKYRLMIEVGVDDIVRSKIGEVSVDEFADFLVTVKGSVIEMRAIATVIGDAELRSLVEHVSSSVPAAALKDPDQSRESLDKFEKSVTNLLAKAYRMLQEVTETA